MKFFTNFSAVSNRVRSDRLTVAMGGRPPLPPPPLFPGAWQVDDLEIVSFQALQGVHERFKRHRLHDVARRAQIARTDDCPRWPETFWQEALSQGSGGTCYGDSGGPHFLGNSNMVVSLTVTGDAWCRATDVTYRLDTDSARSFLAPFVELP